MFEIFSHYRWCILLDTIVSGVYVLTKINIEFDQEKCYLIWDDNALFQIAFSHFG